MKSNLGLSARTVRAVLFAFLCLTITGCFGPPRTETRPEKYSSLITEWTPTGIVTHFPSPLPSTATNIKLSASPGFLQGGAWFQVRFTLPPADVSKVYDTAAKAAKDFYDGGSFYTSANSKEGGLPGTSFHTSDTQQIDFPADYRIFVFAASGGNTWNHGQSHGVVVSKQRNEVIYYAETW
jgi:hypothetical protein